MSDTGYRTKRDLGREISRPIGNECKDLHKALRAGNLELAFEHAVTIMATIEQTQAAWEENCREWNLIHELARELNLASNQFKEPGFSK